MSSILKSLSSLPGAEALNHRFQEFILAIMRTGPVPKHVAFIMDGNRRYAKTNKLEIEKGHAAGASTLVSVSNSSLL